MSDKDLSNLDNQELMELLATLDGMDQILEEQEILLKEGNDKNED